MKDIISQRIKILRIAILISVVVIVFQFGWSAVRAEPKDVNVGWQGITGVANTFGEPRNCGGGSGGVAYSYSHTTANIYYIKVFLREWSTNGGPHVLNKAQSWYYYRNATQTVKTPWNNCNFEYVTSQHTFHYTNNTGPVVYTSGRGTSSTASCWSGANCY